MASRIPPAYSKVAKLDRLACEDLKSQGRVAVEAYKAKLIATQGRFLEHNLAKLEDLLATLPVEAAPTKKSGLSYAQLRRHAKNGSLDAVASDDEIQLAVRCGAISVSEAMNSDF